MRLVGNENWNDPLIKKKKNTTMVSFQESPDSFHFSFAMNFAPATNFPPDVLRDSPISHQGIPAQIHSMSHSPISQHDRFPDSCGFLSQTFFLIPFLLPKKRSSPKNTRTKWNFAPNNTRKNIVPYRLRAQKLPSNFSDSPAIRSHLRGGGPGEFPRGHREAAAWGPRFFGVSGADSFAGACVSGWLTSGEGELKDLLK